MDHVQILTIAYECEASLGNSLNLKDMTKEFLKVFLKKTSALYGVIVEFESVGGLNVLNSFGKMEFLDSILYNTIDMNKKYTILEVIKDFEKYRVLYIPLDDYYLAFVYSNKNRLNINIIANIFSSLRNKIELGIKVSIEHERLGLALLGNNDGIWDWNLVNNTIYFSPRFKEILGYQHDEFKNKFSEWESRVHPDDLQKVFDDIKDNNDAKTDYYENIYRLKHKNGEWIWILDKGKTFFDENGQAIRMLGTHTDITQRKKVQPKFDHQAKINKQILEIINSTDLDNNEATLEMIKQIKNIKKGF
ncbi:MAG: PAS domain-containing protein [Epsilonproteobacteria bacterium]|nr:PAS domain-containing protein [Campylobacterota bacterium]